VSRGLSPCRGATMRRSVKVEAPPRGQWVCRAGALGLDPAVGQGSDLERALATHQGQLFKIEGDK
jgi:hypothetical protein